MVIRSLAIGLIKSRNIRILKRYFQSNDDPNMRRYNILMSIPLSMGMARDVASSLQGVHAYMCLTFKRQWNIVFNIEWKHFGHNWNTFLCAWNDYVFHPQPLRVSHKCVCCCDEWNFDDRQRISVAHTLWHLDEKCLGDPSLCSLLCLLLQSGRRQGAR